METNNSREKAVSYTHLNEKAQRLEALGCRVLICPGKMCIRDSHETIRPCYEAGANVFVSGGYLFKNIKENTEALRKAVRR